MSALIDLETKINGAVVTFQNEVASLLTEAKTLLDVAGEAANPDAEGTAVSDDPAKLAADEAADGAEDSAAASSTGDSTNIPVKDGSTPAGSTSYSGMSAPIA